MNARLEAKKEQEQADRQDLFIDNARIGYVNLNAIDDHGEFTQDVIKLICNHPYKLASSDVETYQLQVKSARELQSNLWELLKDYLFEAEKRGEL